MTNVIPLRMWHLKKLAAGYIKLSNFFLHILRLQEFRLFDPSLFYSITIDKNGFFKKTWKTLK